MIFVLISWKPNNNRFIRDLVGRDKSNGEESIHGRLSNTYRELFQLALNQGLLFAKHLKGQLTKDLYISILE